jgi:WD40 repeat protein
VTAVAFSPDGKLLATASDDGTARLWDPGTGQSVGQPLTRHTGAVYSVAFSPEGKLLATGSADNTARLWDVLDPQAACRLVDHLVTRQQLEEALDGQPIKACTNLR